jgi:hypothetical protein
MRNYENSSLRSDGSKNKADFFTTTNMSWTGYILGHKTEIEEQPEK